MKKLVVAMHRVDARGGQERSTLEVLKRLESSGWNIEVYSFVLDDWPDRSGVTWHEVPGVKIPVQLLKNLWFSVACLFLLRKHLRDPHSVVLTTGVSSWTGDVRVVQFVHTEFLDVLKKKVVPYPNPRTIFHRIYQHAFSVWHSLLERWFLLRAKRLVAISHSVEAAIKRIGESGDRIRVVHHAPDHHDEAPALPDDLKSLHDPEVPIVLMVGALERKGIAQALRALAMNKELSWQFWAVGAGDLERWRGTAADLGIGDRCHFFGARSAAPIFPHADVFLFPSAYEPFGLVVTEAISNGLCPLVSRECGAIELWKDRPEWLELSVEDEDERWGDALKRVLESKDVREQATKDARDAVMGWSWDKAAVAYDGVLKEVFELKKRSDVYTEGAA